MTNFLFCIVALFVGTTQAVVSVPTIPLIDEIKDIPIPNLSELYQSELSKLKQAHAKQWQLVADK
jgi:hypothetical protein